MHVSFQPQAPDRAIEASANDLGDFTALTLRDTAVCRDSVDVFLPSPQALIRLGELIKAEGIRLANERDAAIPEPVHAWTTEQILQHEA